MINIIFPTPDFRIKKENGKDFIFDSIRKKWIILTPEEWVRQNIVAYLITTLHYPPSLIAIEKEIKVNLLKRRCDIVVYKNNSPWLVIECKEPNTSVNEAVLTQVLNYNISLEVEYFIITNSSHTYGWKIENAAPIAIVELPIYTNPA